MRARAEAKEGQRARARGRASRDKDRDKDREESGGGGGWQRSCSSTRNGTDKSRLPAPPGARDAVESAEPDPGGVLESLCVLRPSLPLPLPASGPSWRGRRRPRQRQYKARERERGRALVDPRLDARPAAQAPLGLQRQGPAHAPARVARRDAPLCACICLLFPPFRPRPRPRSVKC